MRPFSPFCGTVSNAQLLTLPATIRISANGVVTTQLSLRPPASSSATDVPASSDSLPATAQPPEPAPTTMKSKTSLTRQPPIFSVALRAKRSNPSLRLRRRGLLRRSAPRKKRLVRLVSSGLRDWLELNIEAELFETCDETTYIERDGPAIKVCSAEVMMLDAVLEDVIDRREDRCSDGTDGLLRSSPALQTEELGSVVAVLLAFGCPGALHQHGLEPGRPLAQARGLALAGAFVVAGAQARPGDEVAGGREAAHVGTDLGEDRGRRHRANPRYRGQKLDQGTKGGPAAFRRRLHARDPLIDFAIELADQIGRASCRERV